VKKLRFKNRNGVLYFGFGDSLKSSRMSDTKINRNILIGKFNRGELEGDLTITPSDTIIKLVEEVLNDKSKHLKHKSMLAYRSSFKNHIIPFFKEKFITMIKPIDIKNFQDEMVLKGLKKDSVQLSRILLKEAFEIAILSELISSSPVEAVSMPKIKFVKKKQKPFTLDEIDKILDFASGSVKNFLGISFFTGMRSGEVLALKWSDINFEIETISITKTIAQGIINATKTRSSERDIEMLPMAKEYFKKQLLETGLKDGYIFLNRNNEHYGTNDFFFRSTREILKKLNIEIRSLHNTRHTFASMMLNNGIEPLWVSHTLGHENLQITYNIYTHFMPKKEKMIIGFLDKRYKNGTQDS